MMMTDLSIKIEFLKFWSSMRLVGLSFLLSRPVLFGEPKMGLLRLMSQFLQGLNTLLCQWLNRVKIPRCFCTFHREQSRNHMTVHFQWLNFKGLNKSLSIHAFRKSKLLCSWLTLFSFYDLWYQSNVGLIHFYTLGRQFFLPLTFIFVPLMNFKPVIIFHQSCLNFISPHRGEKIISLTLSVTHVSQYLAAFLFWSSLQDTVKP